VTKAGHEYRRAAAMAPAKFGQNLWAGILAQPVVDDGEIDILHRADTARSFRIVCPADRNIEIGKRVQTTGDQKEILIAVLHHQDIDRLRLLRFGVDLTQQTKIQFAFLGILLVGHETSAQTATPSVRPNRDCISLPRLRFYCKRFVNHELVAF
jgi:hypothetical protein